jgi:hypothetical protein
MGQRPPSTLGERDVMTTRDHDFGIVAVGEEADEVEEAM